MNAPTSAREAACAAVGFSPLGAAAGNLTLGKGQFEGKAIHVAIVESRIASGSLGALEAAKLAALFRVAALERSPILICLDSAGARVSEGLVALGAFRRLCAEALRARLAGAPMAFVLGANCFGGASFLSMLGGQRLLGPATRLAMSGPSIIAQLAGGSGLDPTMRAVVEAAIGANARSGFPGFRVWSPNDDIAVWLRVALEAPSSDDSPVQAHQALGERLRKAPSAQGEEPAIGLRRECVDRLFPEGHSLMVQGGVVSGTGRRDGASVDVLGLVGKAPVGAASAFRLATLAWGLRDRGASAVDIVLDCESHSARLDDERLLLSAYLADVALALMALRESGATLRLTVIGDAGGGVYLALAAAAQHVAVAVGATVHVLPAAAMMSILGTDAESPATAEDYQRAGVADAEIALGLLDTRP